MNVKSLLRPVWLGTFACASLTGLLYVVHPGGRGAQEPAEPLRADQGSNSKSRQVPTLPSDRMRPKLARTADLVGVTNFALLSVQQLQEYHRVVAPGVSTFVTGLAARGISPFGAQGFGSENFLALHSPTPGNIWDLKLVGKNGRDYCVRFNQTRELGMVAGLTNVVCFFPMAGPSIQGLMEGFVSRHIGPDPAVQVRPRSASLPETTALDLSRAVFRDLGNTPGSFLEMSTTTERTSGIEGGYVVSFRPRGLDQPDNALYDTTFGFLRNEARLVLDTFTYNSARLLPRHRRDLPVPPLAVPRF